MQTVERVNKTDALIRNVQRPQLPRDFRLNPLSFIFLALMLAAGVIWQAAVLGGWDPAWFVFPLAAALAWLLLLALPLWGLALVLVSALSLLIMRGLQEDFYPLLALTVLGLLLAPCLQMAQYWERAVILRLGKSQRVKGPGLFFLLPLLDRVVLYVDTRIRATDFRAEKAITQDTVQVDVDALTFWMIWDAGKAVLEVENYLEAVILSAQTALQSAIGKNTLAALLSEQDRLGQEIQQVLDRKTNPWGITILSIEITDIILPKELEDALSSQAQAAREKESRLLLCGAETEVARRFVEAARKYQEDPSALLLRFLSMIAEGIKKNAPIVVLPTDLLSFLSLGKKGKSMSKGEADDQG